MSRELEYHNAKITSTSIDNGDDDHGIFTVWLTLEFDGGGCGFGGYGMDVYDKEKRCRIDSRGMIGEYLKAIMDVVGVSNWEDVKGKYVVAETEGWGGHTLGIRNIIDEDKWFRPNQWFKENYNLPEDK